MDSTQVLAGALVALALLVACIHYHLKVFKFWTLQDIRGPRPWPLFGTNIYYMLHSKIDTDLKWRQQYGHTYGLFDGYRPVLRTTDNELLAEIYIKQFSSFTDRDSTIVYDSEARNWLFWSHGARWSNQRALITPMFSSSKIRLMFAPMAECIDRLIANTSERIQSASCGGGCGGGGGGVEKEVVFGKSDMSTLTLDVIARCFFGLKLNVYDSERNEFVKQAQLFTKLDWYWLAIWLATPRSIARYLKIDLFSQSRLKYFSLLTQKIVNERRRCEAKTNTNSTDKQQQQQQQHNNHDVIQAFIDARLRPASSGGEQVFTQEDDRDAHYRGQIGYEQLQSVQQKQLNEAKLFKSFEDIEIRGQMVFLFFAGFETTASTLGFAFLELAMHPEIQHKLHAELKSKLNCSSDIELAQYEFTADDYSKISELKVLDSFVSEVMRLYPSLIEFGRVVTNKEGATLTVAESSGRSKSIQLPYGTPISTNVFAVQRDCGYFERANEFELERFYPENRHKIKSCTFLPFGVGPRACVGMRLALLEMKLTLAKMIARFSVAPISGAQVYPPKFKRNAFFLQADHTDFTMVSRSS